MIPGVTPVGGFSLCSSPAVLPFVEIVVKYPLRPHEPALWFHGEPEEGAPLQLRAGGGFTYDPAHDERLAQGKRRHVVLIAGGIGVSPLRSIALQVERYLADATDGGGDAALTMTVLYSAVSTTEMVFANDFAEMAARFPHAISVDLFAADAGPRDDHWAEPPPVFSQPDAPVALHERQQLTQEALSSTLTTSHGGVDDVLMVVCGPPPMTDAVVDMCRKLQVPEEAVLFEKWW